MNNDSEFMDEEPFFPEQEFLARCPTGTYVRALRRVNRADKLFPSTYHNKPYEVEWDNIHRMPMATPEGVTLMTATLQNMIPKSKAPPARGKADYITKLIKGEWVYERDHSEQAKPWKSFVAINKRLAVAPNPHNNMSQLSMGSRSVYRPQAVTKRPIMTPSKSEKAPSPVVRLKNRKHGSTTPHEMAPSPSGSTGSKKFDSQTMNQVTIIEAQMRRFHDVFRSLDNEHTGLVTLSDFQLLLQTVNFGLMDLELFELARGCGEDRAGQTHIRYSAFLRELKKCLMLRLRQGLGISFSKLLSGKKPSSSSRPGTSQRLGTPAFGVSTSGENALFNDDREWLGLQMFFDSNGDKLADAMEKIDAKRTGFVARSDLMKAIVSLDGSAQLPLSTLSLIADLHSNGSQDVNYIGFLGACTMGTPPEELTQLAQGFYGNGPIQEEDGEGGGTEVRRAISVIDRIAQKRPGTMSSRPGISSSRSGTGAYATYMVPSTPNRPHSSAGFSLPLRARTPVEIVRATASSRTVRPIENLSSQENEKFARAIQYLRQSDPDGTRRVDRETCVAVLSACGLGLTQSDVSMFILDPHTAHTSVDMVEARLRDFLGSTKK